MTGEQIIGALIGLVGAVSNNGKTEQTDAVIRDALLHLHDQTRQEQIVHKIHEQKNLIAPDCATCQSPCGNTSDYDMSKLDHEEESVQTAKKQLIETIYTVLTKNEKVAEEIYRGIAYIGYPMSAEDCKQLQEQLLEQYT